MPKNNWSREELILAFHWYCTKISFTKIKYTKPEVIELANLIGRTPSAIAFKLVNFARLDPELQKRRVKGMSHGSNAEKPIWEEFHNNWNELAYESELILAKYKKQSVEQVAEIETADLLIEGKERETIVKVRVNQSFFRKSVLLSYNQQCCITGLKIPELLVASHIIPWSKNLKEACNPENGLCLNALHDKAFDKGLITITDDFKILVSNKLLHKKKEEVITNYFIPYHQKEIIKPNRFLPHQQFLDYHRRNIFIQ
ncbi:HNH endonuclease [Parafilimonas sp.]|uniref:HNH endonuclease n=1 Tax=Parafilimonas sp. TaxID=1969739 RepID=UPI0039E37E7C